jgi:hypothetical protein
VAAFDSLHRAPGPEVADLRLIPRPLPRKGLDVETGKAFESLLDDGAVRGDGAVPSFLPERSTCWSARHGRPAP